MKLKSLFIAACALLPGLFVVLPARAQGVIVPIICDVRPCPPPRPVPRPIPLPNALPVKSIQLDTKINGQVATTHLEQVFRNDTPYTLEGTYFFPIPESASIVEFAIWENGKKLVGEVRSREEARRIYDEIVRRQRDPGLLEYAGKDLFQASIFPIPPNSDKKLELTYSQVLKAESGTVAYRYPLGTGHNLWSGPVSWVEDSTRRPVRSEQKFGTVSGRIEIVGREALRNIYSPSHQIEVKRKGETTATVSFETSNNDNDFQLFYGLSNNDFGMSLLTYREPGKDGYFLLQISPKDNISETELVNKDIVFVLDTSGSMADEGKMEKARKALLFGINSLHTGDRFNVISFSGEEHLMESKPIAADESGKKKGVEFVNRLQPNGGTNINDALRAAMRQFDSSDRPKMLVFMTDGRPTVGESNVERIIKNAGEVKVDGLRMFTFGVGYDVNTQLLDKLAAENSGVADYIEPKEDLEIKVSNFFTKVNSPVLTGLELDFDGVQTDLMYPRQLTDIFKGMQLTIIGRYRNASDVENVTLRLRGKTGRETRSFSYPNLDFPMRADKNDFLPRLWATRRVGWLIEQIRANGENKELRDEIVELGTRYGIVTPYTSYLATDGTTEQPRIERRADRMPAPKSSAVTNTTGQGAVMASRDAKDKKEALSIAEEDENGNTVGARNVKKAGIKTFYLENGVWIDSEYREEAKLPETRLKFASDEFFALLGREKDLGRYFAVGEEVVVVWKDRVYRIVK
ncbi:MAG: VWA domain-containing protein [Acidobacteria bacterium]|nr:VWA domain-containing protein [Acidobacteriota bacterium]